MSNDKFPKISIILGIVFVGAAILIILIGKLNGCDVSWKVPVEIVGGEE